MSGSEQTPSEWISMPLPSALLVLPAKKSNTQTQPGKHSLLAHTDTFLILSDKGEQVRGSVFIGISCMLIETLPIYLISCSILTKLLLTSSCSHMAAVSVRQIQTEMAN